MNNSNGTTRKTYDNSQANSTKSVTKLQSFFNRLKNSYKILILIAIVAIVSVGINSIVSSILIQSSSDVYLPSIGNIKTIEVEIYWDQDGTNPRDNLSWETIEPGQSLNTLVYVKSVSNFKVTLNLTLTDWSPPEITDYITISWDYDRTIVNPEEIIPVTITLAASSSKEFVKYLLVNEITGFNVDVHFIASD